MEVEMRPRTKGAVVCALVEADVRDSRSGWRWEVEGIERVLH